MILDVSKDMLIDMVRGTDPSYEAMGHPLVKRAGEFSGSYGTWTWNTSVLEKYTEGQLMHLYGVVKNG